MMEHYANDMWHVSGWDSLKTKPFELIWNWFDLFWVVANTVLKFKLELILLFKFS